MSAPSPRKHSVLELTRTAQSKSSTLMGSEEDPDPEDSGAVAGAVFGAVFIYIVHLAYLLRERQSFNNLLGVFRLLRTAGLPSYARKPSWRYKSIIIKKRFHYLLLEYPRWLGNPTRDSWWPSC